MNILLLIVMEHPSHERLPSKNRGSYHAYLKNPDISPSKLPRTSLHRRKNSKQAGDKSHAVSYSKHSVRSEKIGEQMEGDPGEPHMDKVAGPSTMNQTEEVEDMLETEADNKGGESEVNFFHHRVFIYPGDDFLDDCVKENNETGDKDDDHDEEDIVLLEEKSDQADLEVTDISYSNDDLGITISEKPIFEGSPLTVTMHIIAINTFAMTQHLSGSTLAHLITLIWLHCPRPNNCVKSLKQLWGFF